MLGPVYTKRDATVALLKTKELASRAPSFLVRFRREVFGIGQGRGFLVTWNCKHIANARILQFVMETCRTANYEPPVICTPEELIEE